MDNYVFTKGERDRITYALPMYWILISIMFLYYMLYPNQTDIGIKVGIVFFAWLYVVGLYAIKYRKFRFARYAFDSDSVSISFKGEKRIITTSDSFQISNIILHYASRYSRIKVKFIVLWKVSVNPPREQISPYIALEKYDILILPCEDYIIDNLEKIFGFRTIPDYPKSRVVINSSITSFDF